MDLKYLLKILAIIPFVIGVASCEYEDLSVIEANTCKVVVSGLQSENSGGGLKVINLNRVSGEADITKNTPENIAGCNINIYSHSDLENPYISQNVQFVDTLGDSVLILSGIQQGQNRFVAESYVDAGIFGGNTHGWDGKIGILAEQTGTEKHKLYSEQIELVNPLYLKYRCVVDANIELGTENNISFNMQPVNGRIAILIENFNTGQVRNTVELYSSEDGYIDPILFIDRNQTGYYLYNNDNAATKPIKLRIVKYTSIGPNTTTKIYNLPDDLPEGSDMGMLYEPGKYKTQIITVKPG